MRLAHSWHPYLDVEDLKLGQPDPEVSVVIATFRREHLLPEAIESVRAQSGVRTELVVIDDSPEGGARFVLETAGEDVRYIHRAQPSGGRPGAPRNDAFALCRAPFVHFLDDDDRLLDGALARLRDALATSGAGMAFGKVLPFGEDHDTVAREAEYFERAAVQARWLRGRHAFVAQLLFLESFLVNSACMVRREAFEEARGYDASLACFEDVDLYLRVMRERGGVFVDRQVLEYRVGGDSLMRSMRGTVRHPAILEAYAAIHRRYRERYGTLEYRSMQAIARGARSVGLA
jgi:glycosyltransferase involved in cell wall biosynthesis